jgi:hypothetical protein
LRRCWERLRAAGRGLRPVTQPQAGPARPPSCGLRAAGRAHGQPPGAGLGRRPVARGATGWARAIGGKGRLIFLYSPHAGRRSLLPACGSPPLSSRPPSAPPAPSVSCGQSRRWFPPRLRRNWPCRGRRTADRAQGSGASAGTLAASRNRMRTAPYTAVPSARRLPLSLGGCSSPSAAHRV